LIAKYCNRINKQYGPQHRSDLMKCSSHVHEGFYRQVYIDSKDNMDRFSLRHNAF